MATLAVYLHTGLKISGNKIEDPEVEQKVTENIQRHVADVLAALLIQLKAEYPALDLEVQLGVSQ